MTDGSSNACPRTLKARIWDAPLRWFHWLFGLAFGAAWLALGDRYLYLHVFAGYAFGGLLLFRLAWGFVGSGHARFRRFLYRPGTAVGYLRALASGRAPHYAGHNPAGSWAVYGMLAVALGLAVTGVLTLGGQEQEGPLAGVLGFGAGAAAREMHEALAWTLVALAGIHIGGVLLGSVVHRENLVGAMVTGRKYAPGEADVTPHRAVAGLMLAGVLGGAALYFYPVLRAPAGEPYRPYTGPRLADDATWRNECGGCHLAYQAGLLPARSWRALLDGQHDHFGEDLALDAATLAHLKTFLTTHAAERQATETAWYVQHTTPLMQTPLRVTATAYWRHKHGALDPALWARNSVHGKADCAACHLDAAAGTFRDGAMHVPPPDAASRVASADSSANSTVIPKEITQ